MAKVISLSKFKRRNLLTNPLDCPTCHNPENKHEDFYWGRTHGNKIYSDCKSCLKEARERKKAEQEQSTPIHYFNLVEFQKYYTF